MATVGFTGLKVQNSSPVTQQQFYTDY